MKAIKFILTILLLNGVLTMNAQIPMDNLVGHWPFNGNANDESGNNNDGIVNGATLSIDRFGNESSAYHFDGRGDNISIPDFNVEFDEMTLSFWFNTSDINLNQRILSHNWPTGAFSTHVHPLAGVNGHIGAVVIDNIQTHVWDSNTVIKSNRW